MNGRQRSSGDAGSALLVAVLTMGVAISLALVGVAIAQGSSRSSGVDRQRLLAVGAAEAGVDAAYTAIQQGGTTPPCSLSTANIRSGPDVAAYATTVTYYDASGATIACPLASTPVRALIRSTATTNTLGGGGSRGRRTMEALVNLNPVNGTLLDKAIFANGSLSFNNKTVITGNNGPDADIYTNSDFACNNNEDFAGSVFSQGTITVSNSCRTAGNVWAKNGVTEGNWNGTIAGFVKAGAGSIKLSNPGSVTGNLYASGTVTYTGGSGCTSGKCFPNGSPGNPPYQPFPIIRGDAATLSKWAAGGNGVNPYTVITDNTCGTIVNKIMTDYSQRGYNVLVSTTCAIALNSSFAVKNDLAIFTKGGLTTGKLTISSSAVGTKRNVHFIVPYDTVASLPCTSPVVDTDKQFDFTNDIDLFIYSPCTITYRNSSNHIGQIYGGSNVSIQNQFNMQFRPVPVLGVDPSSMPAVSFVPSIVYKRETT